MNSEALIATSIFHAGSLPRLPGYFSRPFPSARADVGHERVSGIPCGLAGYRGRPADPSTVLGFLAVACATTNVVGGFIITDRMLRCSKGSQRQSCEKNA
jgi:hypothetical protein